MEETIQKLFAENPYIALAGFVALVAISIYVLKKLKNIIIAILILFFGLSIYLYRIGYISGSIISQLIKADSIEEVKIIYKDFLTEQKEKLKSKTKTKIYEGINDAIEEAKKEN